MGYITQDSSGIPDKQLYKSLAMHFKKGLFAPRMIELEKARELKDLDLKGDTITNLNFLRYFPNLEELNISAPNLKDISGLRYTEKLDWLQILDHNLTDISAVDYCRELTFLNISTDGGNELGKPPAIWDFRAIGNCTNLNTLVLTNNNINDISWICDLKSLTEVYLANNPITDFSPLKELENLGFIEISRDQPFNQEEFPEIPVEYNEIVIK